MLLQTGNAEEAGALWDDAGAELPTDYAASLIPYLAHDNEDVRSAAADGLAAAVEVRFSTASSTIWPGYRLLSTMSGLAAQSPTYGLEARLEHYWQAKGCQMNSTCLG